MLSFFPKPYPDELLYSVFARYHIQSGNTSAKETMKELFNSATNTACIDLPAHLDSFMSNLPLGTSYTIDNFIINNTLYPYYTAFLQNERADKIKQLMRSNSKGEIHNLAGIMASSVNAPKRLNLCIECSKVDKEIYGEVYWHRIHQAPGVLYCPEHKQPLYIYSINTYELNKHIFVAAEECKLHEKLYQIKHGSLEISKFIEIAKDIIWLVNNYNIIRNSYGAEEGFREQYIAILKEKDFATSGGRVYQQELISSFKDYYGEAFLEKVQSNIDYDEQCNWLSSIVRKHRKSFHPLRHILMMRFLSGSIQEFFSGTYEYKPFGMSHWPCLNAASDHYKDLVIKKVLITHCFDTKKPVGTFYCDCGFIYSRRGPDKCLEDRYKIGRIKQFGSVWENKLKQYINEGMGLRETARKLNVDAKTVKKYTSKLGLSSSCIYAEVNLEDNDSIADKYKHRWNELIKQYPQASKTELRIIEPKVYIWLYRNDCDWLNANSPMKKVISEQANRIDWNVRDISILESVKQAVKQLRESKSKPERISIGRIGKLTGFAALLEKHINKMPKTKAYLSSQVESIEEFQIRRVWWAGEQLNSDGEELKVWKILRKAGLRKNNPKEVDKAITQVIAFYNDNRTKAIKK